MYDIYYAHHQWKYNTPVETYELGLIKKYFPKATVFNPSVDLKVPDSYTNEQIMNVCLETVRNSDILIFSSLDGSVGTGVYQEVKEAERVGKIIFYIFQNKLYSAYHLVMYEDDKKTDRLYAYVDVDLW